MGSVTVHAGAAPHSAETRYTMLLLRLFTITFISLVLTVAEELTKSLVETDDAYILEAELPKKDSKAVSATKTGTATATRLFTGNQAIDGAVVGLGVGVIGSLLVGKLLEDKNKCNPRGRRDTANTRFLPGIFGGSKCPSPSYQHSGYQHPSSGYKPNSGYQQPNSGYQQPNSGYQQPNSGYQHPNFGYQQPNFGYQQPNSGYSRPNSGYKQPNPVYPQQNSGYNRPNQGYQQPTGGYQQPYRSHQSGFSQASAHKPTPAPFSSGLQPVRTQALASSYQSPAQGYTPGILGRSLPKSENSKVNF